MQIGIRAHDCVRSSLEDLARNIREQGFSCTQLALKKAIFEFPVDRCAMTPGMAMYIKDVFGKNHVDIGVLGCYLNLAHPDMEQLKEITETYKAHIRFASLLGCGVVGTETGAVNGAYVFEPANHSKKALEIFVDNLRPVVEYAEKMGIIFGIEPVYSHIVCDLDRTKWVLDQIDSPNLQIIFDPVNLLSIDNCKDQDQIMKGAFDLFGDDIAVIHGKDFRVEQGVIKSVAAGTGEFHYDVLMKLLKARKPFIHVLLEDTIPENAIKSRNYVLAQYERA